MEDYIFILMSKIIAVIIILVGLFYLVLKRKIFWVFVIFILALFSLCLAIISAAYDNNDAIMGKTISYFGAFGIPTVFFYWEWKKNEDEKIRLRNENVIRIFYAFRNIWRDYLRDNQIFHMDQFRDKVPTYQISHKEFEQIVHPLFKNYAEIFIASSRENRYTDRAKELTDDFLEGKYDNEIREKIKKMLKCFETN